MNTQTHILLGAVLFAWRREGSGQKMAAAGTTGALAGSLLPDASLFVMWGWAKATGVPERVIWETLYFDAGWQFAGAVTNSIPVYLALALAAYGLGARLKPATDQPIPAHAVLTGALAALVHTACDLPLHAGDGRPHFWPLSNWIFNSPVSYWDPAFHGDIWQPIEIALAVGLMTLLARRFKSLPVRLLLGATFLSYAVMAAYWSLSLGPA